MTFRYFGLKFNEDWENDNLGKINDKSGEINDNLGKINDKSGKINDKSGENRLVTYCNIISWRSPTIYNY